MSFLNKIHSRILFLSVRTFSFLFLQKIVARKEYQLIFERLHLQGLNGMNYGRHAGVIDSGEKNLLKLIAKQTTLNTFIDGGAHRGEYSDLILDTFSNATIYLFEPSEVCIKFLKDKYCNNPNIITVQKGLAASNNSVYLKNDGSKIAELTHEKTPGAHVVESTRIDLFCSQNKIHKIDFIKLDIEGYEYEVISTHLDSFARLDVKIIQFEISSGILRSELNYHLNDIVNILSKDYFIGRILINGIVELPKRIDIREIYLGANYVAIRKDLKNLWDALI